MKSKSIFISLLFIIIAFVFLNCSSSESTNVKIHINLGLNNAGAVNTFENSIFDRIFRLFTKDVEAQTAPSNVTSIILNISGSGMETISNTYPSSTTSIDLEVPSGPSRLFEVLAHTPSATLRGAVTMSLVGGTTVTIPITMGLYETKIVIADPINFRIVQIDNFTTPNWNDKYNTDLGVSNLSPYDIEFDSRGRIYIANNYAATGGGVIRLDDINDSTTGNNLFIALFSVVTVTVDRITNFLYYATTSALYKCDLTPPTPTPIPLISTGISNITGLAVDDTGMLYITCSQGGTPRVIKYNPSGTGSIVTGVFYSMGTGTPWDVMYKEPYIYVTNLAGLANRNILQLDTNLAFIAGYGTNVSSGTAPGQFYGPRKFVAIKRKEIIITDDDETFPVNADKIVSIDDILGTNWATYGTSGGGLGAFAFYNQC